MYILMRGTNVDVSHIRINQFNTRNQAKCTENKIILTNMALPLTILLKLWTVYVGHINYAK